ncbi:MAG: helicase-associated domain-containing protein [Pseudonocardiaceae bacterium]
MGYRLVWTLTAAGLLAAVDAGRPPADLASFLAERAVHGLPATVRTLLDDVAARARQVRDLGMRRVVECADATVATLLTRDRTLRPYCTRIGDRHLLLAPDGEAKVRTALRKLGYALGLQA